MHIRTHSQSCAAIHNHACAHARTSGYVKACVPHHHHHMHTHAHTRTPFVRREDAKASLTSPPTWEFLGYLALAGGGCLGPWVYHAQGLATGGALPSQNLALALAVSEWCCVW
jgi:hypothetical protein